MGISVVLLAYKEEENLRVLLPQIIEEVEKCNEEYEILVVDTMKPLDNTIFIKNPFGIFHSIHSSNICSILYEIKRVHAIRTIYISDLKIVTITLYF